MQSIMREKIIWLGNVDPVDFQEIFPIKLYVLNVNKEKVTQKIMK